MVELHAVSKTRHASKFWHRVTNLGFAAQTNAVPVSGGELARATLSFPLAFVAKGDQQTLVAMLGLAPGQNLFVGPKGQWVGDYIPATLRGYPFQLARNEQQGLTLVVDETSGLVSDGPDGVPFFDAESSEPHPDTKTLFSFLEAQHRGLSSAAVAVAAIKAAGLMEPWPLTVQTDQGSRTIEGVSRISEERLRALPIEDLDKLRHAGGLVVAYAQLFSVQNLRRLQLLAQMASRSAQPKPAHDTTFLPELDDEKFDWDALIGK